MSSYQSVTKYGFGEYHLYFLNWVVLNGEYKMQIEDQVLIGGGKKTWNILDNEFVWNRIGYNNVENCYLCIYCITN